MRSQLSDVKSVMKSRRFHLLQYLLYLGFSNLVILVFYLNCTCSCCAVFWFIRCFPLLPQTLVPSSCCVLLNSNCSPTRAEIQAAFQSRDPCEERETAGLLIIRAPRSLTCCQIRLWAQLGLICVVLLRENILIYLQDAQELISALGAD